MWPMKRQLSRVSSSETRSPKSIKPTVDALESRQLLSFSAITYSLFPKATAHVAGQEFSNGTEKRYTSLQANLDFRENAKKHPDQWFVHTGLARMYCAQGKFDDAAKEMKLSMAGAPDNQKSYLDGLVSQLEGKQDINQ